MATITKPMALDESFKTTESTSRNQADVLAGIEEAIRQGFGQVASAVEYDNTDSGLTADNVQDAIDEVDDTVDGLVDDVTEISNNIESTQTASGNPITLTDASETYAEVLSVELEPKQDLHGYDYPWVGGAGKNKMPYASLSGTLRTTQSITLQAGTYTISANVISSDTDYNKCLVIFRKNQNELASFYMDRANRANATFSLNSECDEILCYASNNWANSEGDTVSFSDIQIEEGSTATAYEDYENICPISGYTECEVDDVGFNLISEIFDNKYINHANGQAGTAEGFYCTDFIKLDANTVYYFKDSSDNNQWGAIYDLNKTFISAFDVVGNTEFTSPNYDCYFRITVHADKKSSVNISKTTGIPKNGDYVPYTHKSATIQFGQTVYGGRSNFTDGGTDDEWEVVEYDGSSDENWTMTGSGSAAAYAMTIPVSPKANTSERPMSNYATGLIYSDTYGNYDCFISVSDGDNFVAGKRDKTSVADWKAFLASNPLQVCYKKATPTTIATPPTDLKLLKQYNNITTNGTTITLGYQPDNVIGEVKGEIEDVTPISGTATVTLLHEEDQGEDWIVGFAGEINGHFDTDHFDYYLTARYSHAYNAETQILNLNNCSDGDYSQIIQTGTYDLVNDGGVTVDISVTPTKLTFAVNCIGDSIFGIYSSSETTGAVKYLITPARRG